MEDQRPPRVVYPAGTKIDEWTIKDHIGHGGYGEIYEVSSRSCRTPVAMKVEPKDAKKQGMAEEIIFLTYLQDSPYFPRFICQGETDEIRYFVMELLGPSLSVVRRWMPRRRLTPLTATLVARDMLLSICELHTRGFVHRDIKPANFLFRNDPEREMTKNGDREFIGAQMQSSSSPVQSIRSNSGRSHGSLLPLFHDGRMSGCSSPLEGIE
jgi:serine/threonine protein kinase